MSDDVWYFAYGSNMSRAKMRCVLKREPPSGQKARLEGYALAFNKLSTTWGYAANIGPEAGGVVWGVLYPCTARDLAELDNCEKGYHRSRVPICQDGGKVVEALTYEADCPAPHPTGVPKPCYTQMLLDGAREHGLPEEYIKGIEAAARLGETYDE